MTTVMVPSALADQIVEELGVNALEDYHNAIMVNLTACEGLYDGITEFFALSPNSKTSFFAPIWNSSGMYH